MYNNRHYNDSIKNDLNGRISVSCTSQSETRKSKTLTKNSGATNVSLDTNTKYNWNAVEQHEGSHIGEYSGATSPSCTSSTDSGVNICDSDEITRTSSTSSQLQSIHPSTVVRETNTAVTLNYDNFHENNKKASQYNNIQINKDSNCKIINNNNKNCIFNGCNDDGFDINSENFDNNKFNADCGNGSNSTRYQVNQNTIENKNAINITQQPNLPTLLSNDKNSLHHNEFNNLQQRPASPASSLSMSSTSNSCDGSSPSKTHQCNNSPVVSVRSICSAIITSDSDSDHSSDSEGVHENYVIKKLGTQVTYSPNDPSIPNINSGHNVLNQKVIANNDKVPLALDTLAAIGDNIGAAHALGQGSSIGAAPQRPQIGSIAVSNSSDVTFGDKHFYEGPVTIQQFLIDTQEKWKETNGIDNPAFVEENVNAKDINSSPQNSSKLYKYILKRRKMVIPGVLAFMTLLIVASVLTSRTLNDSKSKIAFGNGEESRNIIPINSTIAEDNIGGGYVLRIVPRDGWLSQPPVNPLVELKLPVDRVIVIPTRTSECETQAACTYTVRITQTYNIESQQKDDIIYNFLIGGDGNVYEGRGWNNRGSVVKGFNDDSISFAYIGSFKKQPPSYKQLNVTKLLLEEGVRLKRLSTNYKIVGANKLDPTSVATIADALYKSFENWPHWSDK